MASYADLKKKIADLEKQAEEMRTQEVSAVIAEIKQKMAAFGITIDDLKPRKRVMPPSVPRYKDPASGKTWTGRGIAPKWLKDGMAKGKKKEDFLIKTKK